MVIKGKRIRSLDKYLGFTPPGSRIVLGTRADAVDPDRLIKAGLDPSLKIGDTVLPDSDLGPVSRFNAEGTNVVHRDQPMETVFRQVEWTWTEWHGRYDVERSRIVDVPYQRYPRTFVAPPSVELTVSKSGSGNVILVTRPFEYSEAVKDAIRHAVNLLLEIAGECEIFTENLNEILRVKVRRLNWEVLPPGRRPWPELKRDVEKVIREAPEGNWRLIQFRLEQINGYGPAFVAIGQAGFRGYLIFGFPERNLYVLESTRFGNATYVFAERWEELSQLTKAEVLNADLHHDRIIHREGWSSRIRQHLDANAA